MLKPLAQSDIVTGVSREVYWWLSTRKRKMEEEDHDSMAINPFMAPLLMGMHGFVDFGEMAAFMLGGHLSTGHATGFGKLIDEKILPNVFRTVKLSAGFRTANAVYKNHLFDEIDHLIPREGGTYDLLTLKAGRWTIQLTMAVQLNGVFKQLIALRAQKGIAFKKIVLGVFYGRKETLTDKFAIARGINTGAKHDVTDITGTVEVLAGREFWAWLNCGETNTQEWVLEGILAGLDEAVKTFGSLRELTEKYKKAFARKFQRHINDLGVVDWAGILKEING